ncbi:UDP-glucose 4-epimerase GalE [Prochlorococcus marinus str. MU1402]|uniref:UDP-glucose 4-epimerase GalE n=1 Tax=Prochlorococcus marinus TaxID=1219 RepID=UPI001ADD2070|nr:UDP-glucose 4-epimerase GalE [Prochlorococcus marinus]MBO8232350.1 UDP-glucose 4-epimerase GalE [Prochlorococcus marinus XMU1402]MBW3057078.1 UDP-glucose 4-epimerase GalE [Prochlorococcus marinus str. MU1402]
MSCILISGGFGYIGSHTATLLSEKNQKYVIVDNFSNCKREIVDKIRTITKNKVCFYDCDIRDNKNLIKIINENKVTSVIHFAALKSVSESIVNPLEYYEVNVNGTISLLKAMQLTGVKKFLFSSSAAVYGEPDFCPIDESHILKPLNPYAQTKIIIENILKDIYKAEKNWSVACLRYFNPIGAHKSGLIGDDPLSGKNANLMPEIIKVVRGIKDYLEVFGDDYPTPDGTGIRDYIHIMDLAEAHYKALNFIDKKNGINFFNIGTGKGVSVLELKKAFENVSGLNVPIKISKRREGDCAACFANPKKANDILKWSAKYDLNQMCESSWKFVNRNSK